MKRLLKILAFLYIVAFSAYADGKWTQKAAFGGTARYRATGFSINGKGYLGTGGDGSSLYKDFWEYDPQTNTWTQKADFGGTARDYVVGFSIGSKGYIGTGVDSWDKTKDFWEYDPQTNTWTQKADFGGTARIAAVGFSIGDKGYIGTGSVTKDFWEYDPQTNTWTQKADFGGGLRSQAVGFSIGDKGYIGTGWNGSSVLKDFWEYDPQINTWTQKADFGGTARWGVVGFSVGNSGYIGLGYDGLLGEGTSRKDLWNYDKEMDTWTQKADFSGSARWEAVGFSIGSKGYIGTGKDKRGSTVYIMGDFWEYDTTNSFVVEPVTLPNEYKLYQNSPNPFNTSTTISYSILEKSYIEIAIYNSAGQKIECLINNLHEAGRYEVQWNASKISSGIYFYRIVAGSTDNLSEQFVECKEMILLR